MARRRILASVVLANVLAWSAVLPAGADGGYFPKSRTIAVSTGQRAIIVKDADDTSITFSSGYTGEGDDFCWIIPTPVPPAISGVVETGKAGEDAFRILDELSAPEVYTRSGGGCFPQGTEVLTAGGPLAIEKVAAGTKVYAYAFATGEWVAAAVLQTFTQQYDGDMVSIHIGSTILRATGNHPFYVVRGDELSCRPWPPDVSEDERGAVGSGRWVEARSLRAGDLLETRDGSSLSVTGVSTRREKAVVYNLSVQGHSTYAVLREGVLVHNKGKAAAEPGSQELVTVYGRATLEHYEISILGATGATALLSWLDRSGYEVNPASKGVLDVYIDAGWSFVAVKLNPAEKRRYENEYLPPLAIRYRSGRFVFPLRISSVSTTAVARITLYVIAESTVHSTNLPTRLLEFEKHLSADANPEAYLESCMQKTIGDDHGRTLVVLWSGQVPARASQAVTGSLMGQPFAEGAVRHLTRLEARIDPAGMTEDIELSLDEKPKGFMVMLAGRGYGSSEEPAGIALTEAVRAGDTERVRLLLAAGADGHSSSAGGALQMAAYGGRDEIVRLLLAAGPEPRFISAALVSAAGRGHRETVQLLLAAGVDAKGRADALTQAAHGGHAEVAKLLLATGEDVATNPAALCEAADEGRTDMVEQLLGAGALVDSRARVANAMASFKHAWTPLMYGVSRGYLDTVRLLLDAGADVNAGDDQGTTALMLAAMEWSGKRSDTLRFLLEAGARVDAKRTDGLTALMMACGAASTEYALMLLRAGADANAQRADGVNALMLASVAGHPEVVRLLVAGGADIDARDARGRTALMLASEGDINALQVFLETAANSGHGLIGRALKDALAAQTKAVQVLLELGADPNAKDNRGWTPLRYAGGRPPISALLIEAGATE